jgi:hypothetical protein
MSAAETRATRAKQLLEDPLLSEVFDMVEDAAIEVWRKTGSAQNAEREIAWQSLKAVERVRATLAGIVDNGLIEARRAVQSSSRA